jgi:hypothetical protein
LHLPFTESPESRSREAHALNQFWREDMALLTQPSSAARTSLIYITVGALTLVWTGVWWAYLRHYPSEEVAGYTWYICYGLMLTGGVVLLIGLAVGQIGRQARHAELPPADAMNHETKVQEIQATAPVVAPGVAAQSALAPQVAGTAQVAAAPAMGFPAANPATAAAPAHPANVR